MKNKTIYAFKIGIIVLSIVMVVSFLIILSSNSSKVKTEKLTLTGTIQYDNKMASINNGNLHEFKHKAKEYIIKGHFNQEILDDDYLTVRIENIKLTILKNSQVIYEYDDYLIGINTTGFAFFKVKIGEINPEDDIEIRILNCNSNDSVGVCAFFEALALSQESAFEINLWNSKPLTFYFCIFLILFALILAIVVIYSMILGNKKYHIGLSVALISLIGSCWILFDFNSELLLGLGNGKAFKQVYYNLNYGLIYLVPNVTLFLVDSLITKRIYKSICFWFYVISILNIVFVMLGITGVIDLREFQIVPIIIQVPINIFMIVVFVSCLKDKESSKASKRMIFSLAPVLFLGIVQIMNFLFRFSVFNGYLSIGYIFTIFLEAFLYLGSLRDMIIFFRKEAALEKELADSKIKITLSQIQPHFIFNILQSVRVLMDTDIKKAISCLEEFIIYLRENLSSLSSDELIPFNKEIDHVIHYVNLEKIRFEERIIFETELADTDFLVPPLSIQPLVENAIKHGITKRPEAGHIKITTYRKNNIHYIIISDDGIGFDTTKKLTSEHVGLTNIKKRIESLTRGSVSIHSKIGVGTTINIEIH